MISVNFFLLYIAIQYLIYHIGVINKLYFVDRHISAYTSEIII